jgi:hypothetical protein
MLTLIISAVNGAIVRMPNLAALQLVTKALDKK